MEQHTHWPTLATDQCPLEHIWDNLSALSGQTINCDVFRQWLCLLKQQEGKRFDTFIFMCKRVISRCAYNDPTDALLDTLLSEMPLRYRDQALACPTTSLQSLCLTAKAITGTSQSKKLSIIKPKEVQKPDSLPCTNYGRSHTI